MLLSDNQISLVRGAWEIPRFSLLAFSYTCTIGQVNLIFAKDLSTAKVTALIARSLCNILDPMQKMGQTIHRTCNAVTQTIKPNNQESYLQKKFSRHAQSPTQTFKLSNVTRTKMKPLHTNYHAGQRNSSTKVS